MAALSSQDFIDSFYKNRKIDPKNNFPLINKEWEKITDRLETKPIFILILSFLSGAIVGFIYSSVFKFGSVPLMSIFGAFFGFLLGLFISLFYILLKSDSYDAFSFYENGVPKSLVYSLRSWINSRYEMNLSNAEIVSLLLLSRTPLNGERYKLVYSTDRDYILDLVIDNSCPSKCCDVDSLDKRTLEENNISFKI